MQAIDVYRSEFRPSEAHPAPYLMLGVNVFAAETEGEARRLMSSVQQAFVSMRTGRGGRLRPPVDDYEGTLGPVERAILEQTLSCSFAGTAEQAKKGLDGFVARTGADELMVVSQVFDHAARLRSYELVAPVPREGQLRPSRG